MSDKNILGPACGYSDLLDFEIAEKLKTEQNKYFPLRPSSSGYCSRRLAYELHEYLGKASYAREPQAPNVYRLLKLGSSVEYSALKDLELLKGFKVRYKQQLMSIGFLKPVGDEPPILIEGSIDCALISDNFKCILDVKSFKDGWSVAFKSRLDETLDKYNNMSSLQRIGEAAYYADDLDALVEELGDDFVVDNLLQINLYCTSQFAKERGIDHGVVWKYGKNDSRIYEIRFRPSEKLKQAVLDKFQHIYTTVMTKGPEHVERDCRLGSMKCAFSPVRHLCWPEDDPLKAWFKTLPKKQWAKRIGELGEATAPLADLFAKYEAESLAIDKAERLEEDILNNLLDLEIKKIKIDNGNVYEVKYLKSPKEHFELRRSKE